MLTFDVASDWEKAILLWGNGVSRAKRVQRNLKEEGHYAVPIDGIIGPVTRRGLISQYKARREQARANDQNC